MNRYTGRTRQRTSSHTSAKVKKGTFRARRMNPAPGLLHSRNLRSSAMQHESRHSPSPSMIFKTFFFTFGPLTTPLTRVVRRIQRLVIRISSHWCDCDTNFERTCQFLKWGILRVQSEVCSGTNERTPLLLSVRCVEDQRAKEPNPGLG